jgi:hypothetical protein
MNDIPHIKHLISSYDESFDYFSLDHYVIQQVKGSLDECLKTFEKQANKYPRMKYSTHVFHREKISEDKYRFVIRRFKTIALCKKHLDYPPTYIRKGEAI